jgi:uncharacterized protein YecE (DUF72 family)
MPPQARPPGRILVGTSGWSYPHWRGLFYAADVRAGDELRTYCQSFDTVEINLSFYRLPMPQMVATWHDTTPPGFTFAWKAAKYITHRLKLRDAAEPVVNVVRRAVLLQTKLGPILFQCSPSLKCDLAALGEFLELLPRPLRFAFEFRHASWFADEVYELLARHGCALAIADTPKYPIAFELTADFAYMRLHGHQALYQSSYSGEELSEWARMIREWSEGGRDVYVYFDNDFLANAPRNALALKGMIGA